MKIFLGLVFVIGLVTLAIGINAWVSALKTANAASVLFGATFGFSIIIFGSVILIVDIILILIYILRKRKTNKIT